MYTHNVNKFLRPLHLYKLAKRIHSYMSKINDVSSRHEAYGVRGRSREDINLTRIDSLTTGGSHGLTRKKTTTKTRICIKLQHLQFLMLPMPQQPQTTTTEVGRDSNLELYGVPFGADVAERGVTFSCTLSLEVSVSNTATLKRKRGRPAAGSESNDSSSSGEAEEGGGCLIHMLRWLKPYSL
ncbi:hypothetical protein PIB30_089051 [Stylosanthes scabra]|uniref:Uncharacterized protein n=1 Tax=Stylosanthes scabra TaxID=79078 RepID=A0ABU6SW94_9FABA|nr:hypothetical protein [Stylosanthes scabra]